LGSFKTFFPYKCLYKPPEEENKNANTTTHKSCSAILFFTILALTVACTLGQTKPKLSSTFETHSIVQISHNGSVVVGTGTPQQSLSSLTPRSEAGGLSLTPPTGTWLFDFEAGKSFETAFFGGLEHLGFTDLARFDLVRELSSSPSRLTLSGVQRESVSHLSPRDSLASTRRVWLAPVQKKNYFISTADFKVCHVKDLTEKIRSPWEWLENAELVGNITRDGVLFDLWQYKTGGTPPRSIVVV
jgi:hypothetical protein